MFCEIKRNIKGLGKGLTGKQGLKVKKRKEKTKQSLLSKKKDESYLLRIIFLV